MVLSKFPSGIEGKESACNEGDMSSIPELGKKMATHSSILAWKILLCGKSHRGAWWATIESDRSE